MLRVYGAYKYLSIHAEGRMDLNVGKLHANT
jgi:hypothetical protein